MEAYGYDAANHLTTANGAALTYDLAGRLATVGGTDASRFIYDGHQVIGELDGAGALVRRYIPGPGLDDVVAAYEGSGFDRRWHYADERGSVISLADNAGASTGLNTYDEYGVPGAGNIGLLQYTGQMWLPQAQLHHYRARAYAPQLGRFMQTDPIGYGDGANLYAYVGGDPVNWTDPLGLEKVDCPPGPDGVAQCPDITFRYCRGGWNCISGLEWNLMSTWRFSSWDNSGFSAFGAAVAGSYEGRSQSIECQAGGRSGGIVIATGMAGAGHGAIANTVEAAAGAENARFFAPVKLVLTVAGATAALWQGQARGQSADVVAVNVTAPLIGGAMGGLWGA